LKVVLNRTEFWTFFAIPNFKVAVPPKFVHTLSAPLSTTSHGKLSLGYSLGFEVTVANSLKFKPILDPPLTVYAVQ